MPKDSVFNTIAEYVDFAKKHGVFGNVAIELKKKIDKQLESLIPKIKPGLTKKR